VEREVFVDAAETSNEVILEGADGAFSSIAAVDSWWGKLKVNFFFAEELFQWFGAFNVETLEKRTQSGGAQFGMDDLKSGKDGGACAFFDGFGEDAVAVIIIDNYQIVVASAGWGRKAARLITVDLSCWFMEGGEAKVGVVIWNGTGRKEVVIC
jgi:hypothetical protein